MASALIFDLDRFNLDRVLYDRASIYSRLPHRYEFEQLDGVVHLNHEDGEAIAYIRVEIADLVDPHPVLWVVSLADGQTRQVAAEAGMPDWLP